MSTSVERYWPPALPVVRSWYAMPSAPPSKFSAWTRPGMAAGVRPYGVDGAFGADVVNRRKLKLPVYGVEPLVSNARRSTCAPAVRWMPGFAIDPHVCDPPVVGTVIG